MDQDTISPSKNMAKKNKSVLIISGDKAEDLELIYPWYRLTEEGYKVDIASPGGKEIKAKNGYEIKKTIDVKNISAEQYDLLYLPGGKAPAKIRDDENVQKAVKAFIAAGKPIAAICHGPQILVSIDAVRGKRMAAWPEVAKEIEEAGGIFVNEAVVEDGQFITGRWPGDLPAHLAATIKHLEGAAAASQNPSFKKAG